MPRLRITYRYRIGQLFRNERPANPFDKIRLVADYLDNGLTVQAIARRYGSEPQDVDKLFTQRSPREIAMGARPIQKVDQIMEGFHGAFSVMSIASALGISEKRAQAVFTDQVRTKLASKAIKDGDVYARARGILQTAGELEMDGIPARIAAYLARNFSLGEAKARAYVVASELANKPPRTSDLMWMWIVAMTPWGTHQQRLDSLQMRRSWFSITARGAAADPQNDWRFDQYARDHTLIPSPADMDPSQSLLELGQRAGVSPGDLKQLLLFFGNSSLCEIDDEQATELIAQVQALQRDSG